VADARDYLTYPITIKTMDGYMQIESADEYLDFHLAGLSFVQTALATGWAGKNALREMTIEQLINTKEQA
jgi:hypothetical protein